MVASRAEEEARLEDEVDFRAEVPAAVDVVSEADRRRVASEEAVPAVAQGGEEAIDACFPDPSLEPFRRSHRSRHGRYLCHFRAKNAGAMIVSLSMVLRVGVMISPDLDRARQATDSPLYSRSHTGIDESNRIYLCVYQCSGERDFRRK